jgi:hypothetical protein
VKDHGRFFHKVKELMAERHTLFITTKSQSTFPKMEQIFQDILEKMPSIAPQIPLSRQRDEAHFCAENGECILREHFNADAYTLKRYDLVTQIIVDRPQASFEYVFSTPRYNLLLQEEARDVYQQLWLQALSRDNLFLDTYKETLYVLTH